MTAYDKPPELYDGLRLHQNENTAGCSPRVLEALAKLRPDQIGFYPPYEAATAACATYLGVDPDRLSLLNGLDEGIMATAVSYLRPQPGQSPRDTIIPELHAFPNVVVGRTFSKAFGLAGLRIGAITGDPATLEPIRLAVPVYSVNIAAVVAVQAALQDLDYLRQYVREVEESRTL